MKGKGNSRSEARVRLGASTKERGEKKRANAEWCPGAELLLPGLDNDTALRCLAFVPTYLHPLLACLNRTYHRLIVSARCAPLMHLRSTLGLVDHLLISKYRRNFTDDETVHSDGQEQVRAKMKEGLRVLDVKRNTWMYLAVPPFVSWHEYDTFFCSGTRLFCFSYSIANAGIQYDFMKHEWEVCRHMQVPTRRLCAFAAGGGCCFVAGGYKTNGCTHRMGEVLRSAEMYSLAKGTWHCLPCMPAARQACAGFIMDNKFYVIGGSDDGRCRSFADGEEYDPSTKVWQTIPGMCFSASHYNSPLIAVHNNHLYAIDDKASSPLSPMLHVYEKQANTWRPLGPILDKHGEGNLHIRDGGLLSMGCDTLLVVAEWWPRIEGDTKRAYVLSWEASPEAVACEFKIIYSGQADRSWFNDDVILKMGWLKKERFLRLYGEPWLAVVI